MLTCRLFKFTNSNYRYTSVYCQDKLIIAVRDYILGKCRWIYMNEFMMLIGQIFVIACLQNISEVFIEGGSKTYLLKVLNVACYVGAFYLVLQFVFASLMPEIIRIFNVAFWFYIFQKMSVDKHTRFMLYFVSCEVTVVLYIGVWSSGMTEVSKTFSGSSILSTPDMFVFFSVQNYWNITVYLRRSGLAG